MAKAVIEHLISCHKKRRIQLGSPFCCFLCPKIIINMSDEVRKFDSTKAMEDRDMKRILSLLVMFVLLLGATTGVVVPAAEISDGTGRYQGEAKDGTTRYEDPLAECEFDYSVKGKIIEFDEDLSWNKPVYITTKLRVSNNAPSAVASCANKW